MKKLLVLSTMIALLSGLTAQAATIQENPGFPAVDLIGNHYLRPTGNDGNAIVRNEDSSGNDLKVLAGQSFTLSSPATLAAITVQQGIGKNYSKAAASNMVLWVGGYDTSDVSNHVAGATNVYETIPMASQSFTGGKFYTFNLDTPTVLPAGDYAFQLFWVDQSAKNVHRTWFNRSTTGGYDDGQLIAEAFSATNMPPIGETSGEDVHDLIFALHSAEVGTVLSIDPAELSMLVIDDQVVTGAVDAVYSSVTNMDVTITISDESHPGSFSVLSASPQTLTNETTELSFEFDNTVSNLAAGASAAGLVTIAWEETGGGAIGTNYMPISAQVAFPANQANSFKGYAGTTAWGTATNWSKNRVPGTLGADKAIIQDSYVVDVATDFTGALAWGTIVRGDGAVLNIGADFLNADYMTLSGASNHYGFVNQTQGSVEVTALKIGHSSGVSASNSVYALSGGTLTSSADGDIYSNGQIVINGGTLTYDTGGNNDIDITSDGLLTLESGTWSSTAGAAGDVLTFNPNVEISGGTINLPGRNHFSGEFKIIGDAASISMQRLNVAPDFIFEFAPGGGTNLTVVECPTYVQLAAGTILVDGSNYTGGSAEIPLFSTVKVSSLPISAVTTNFADGVTATITADMDTDTVILTITVSGFSAWIEGFGLTGDDLLPETDVEPDGLDNLMEYALGGNPTNDDAAVVSPKTYTEDDGGTDYFYHVSDQRADDASLTFVLGSETALTGTPAWDTNDVSFVGASAISNNYKTVTNRTEATPSAKFIQLEVQQD